MRNNIAYKGASLSNATIGNGVDAASNTWNLSVQVSDTDFESTDTAEAGGIPGVYGPRQADGRLPAIRFMKLRQGSDLIDKGVDLRLGAYAGVAPDLGAFEYGAEPSPILKPGPAAKASPARFPRQSFRRDAAGRIPPQGRAPVLLLSR